jgi:beta-glucosidase
MVIGAGRHIACSQQTQSTEILGALRLLWRSVGHSTVVLTFFSDASASSRISAIERRSTPINQHQRRKCIMATSFHFPSGFLWGAATAAHQVEGNNINSDFWVMEYAPGSMFAEPSGDACDHYHRYRDDIALLAGLGFNTYRFSVEWARIEPEEGHFSQAALDHYRRMLATCHEHGLTPMVTFHHFTSPRWLITAGGWESDETPARFARYCERTARHLGDLMGAACTINEANIGAVLVNAGFLPPVGVTQQTQWWTAASATLGVAADHFAPFLFALSPHAADLMLEAHRRGVEAIKSAASHVPVGITLALQDIQAVPGGEVMAAQLNWQINDAFLEQLQGEDFVGVQSYSRMRVGEDGPLPPEEGIEVTQMGYEFYPEALEAVIRYAIGKAHIPVIVTENGISTSDDTRRIAYVERALQGVTRCLQDGLAVQGYMYWSALDNYEWMLGYRPTFGLIAVDRSTQQRTVKPSARWLGAIARANAFQQVV